MRRVGVARVSFAAGPDFVEQEGAGAVGGTVEVIGEAAVFFARGADEGAEFGFEEHFLAVAGTELHDERHGVFRELRGFRGPGFAAACWRFLCFALGHGGRDSTPRGLENPNALERMEGRTPPL